MVFQILMAYISSAAFTIVFNAPKRVIAYTGFVGAAGWLVYLLVLSYVESDLFAVFVASFAVTIISRELAYLKKTPVTVFLISGILPFVPGIGIYNTMYAIINQSSEASAHAINTFEIAGVIAIGIIVALSLPVLPVIDRKKSRGSGKNTQPKGVRLPSDKIFELPIADIQPSQLYISQEKLRQAREWFNPADKSNLAPIPIKLYNGRCIMTDGHHRALLAVLSGWTKVSVIWDDTPLDMLAYALDVRRCDEAGIKSAADLAERIIPHKDYEVLWLKYCEDKIIPPSYAAITARFGGLDGRHNVVILTDNSMHKTAMLIKEDCIAFVKSIEVINLDNTNDYGIIYSLMPDDLLILNIGMGSWMSQSGKYKDLARAFDKPGGIICKYICIRPTITAQALLEGLNTPEEITKGVIREYGSLQTGKPMRVTAKSGTDITLVLRKSRLVPYTTHKQCENAYLPPAEISYEVDLGLEESGDGYSGDSRSANGVVVADITVGELRINADLTDSFGLVDEPVKLHITNGGVSDITGGETARRLKAELWKLSENCRKIVELGFGLSRMTPSGIIGIDESIAGTCHFGIGNGSGNDAPIHLDVVVGDFSISFPDADI